VPGADHSLANLRALCAQCHSAKSALEGVEARRRALGRGRAPQEQHPGAL